jgi:DNA mismatch repair protein MutS
MSAPKLTPLMEQYFAIKATHPETILMFQVGDFYELFFDDAKTAAQCLGIALTKRGNIGGEPIPLCGVPVHALQHYLIKLVRAGHKVAICDQLHEAVQGKVVERGVTQVLTPGTLTDSQLLDATTASYLCAFFPMQDAWGLLFAELLSAQLFGTVLPVKGHRAIDSELSRFMPDEILLPKDPLAKPFVTYFKQLGYATTVEALHADDINQRRSFDRWMVDALQPQTQTLCTQKYPMRAALELFYHYLQRNNQRALQQFDRIQWYDPEKFLMLDAATQRNLELVKNCQDGSTRGTLFSVLNQAVTPMGSRMIKKWIMRPLLQEERIAARLDTVGLFAHNLALVEQLEPLLKQLGDLERVIGRIALDRAHLSDYLALKDALAGIPELVQLLRNHHHDQLLELVSAHILDFSLLHQLLQASLNADSSRDWIVAPLFDQELDRMRQLSMHGNEQIAQLEREEQRLTGIASLKIGFNAVQGYYIEVTKTHAQRVPERYLRQQTLANRERYITPELQRLQVAIRQALQDVATYEAAIFKRIKDDVMSKVTPLRALSQLCSQLDALFGLGRAARMYDFVRPIFNHVRDLHIEKGRHPVVQMMCAQQFIPNDTHLDDTAALWIITGPNMGGKSTYLRQVALICIMAQMGSFVPVEHANLALLDRIFTRIGAGDNLNEGKSTFLVEMEETAAICSQATEHSLVILDEVGRGTSTYDGLAIAQAVIEHIFFKVRARCLFATHYHELTHLQERIAGIASYYAASTKQAHGITFLYRIIQGVADGSFGVQVAKLAMLPPQVVARAQEILAGLDAQTMRPIIPAQLALDQKTEVPAEQDKMAKQYRVLKQRLAEIDFDNLSPKKAWDLLWELKQAD